jgi:hypothetical protein
VAEAARTTKASRRGAANTHDGSSHDREEERSRLTVVLTAAGLPLCEAGNTALIFADRLGKIA